MSIPLIPTKNSVVGSATAPTAAQIPNNGQFAVNAFTGRAYMRTEGGNSVDPARVTLSGDVTGTTATATSEAQGGTVAATVAKIQGRTVASTAPTSGQALGWNSTSSQWEPTTITTATATSIQGRTVASTAPTSGQALGWNSTSSQWEPTTISSGTTSILGFNRVINGAMAIDQRNAGAGVTPVDGAYTLDRWQAGLTQASKFSIQQNAGAISGPTGFANYLGATSLTTYAVLTGDNFGIRQQVEGFNFADFGFGTAAASSVTLSFWVRSNLTGTFGGSLRNSASNRSYPFTYAIAAANTWEQKTVTIAGDTSGTWIGATSGIGVSLNFSLGAGATFSGTAGAWAGSNYTSATSATSVVAGTGNTFYITGVQLQKGTVATSFDASPYGTELALCQRYCVVIAQNSFFGTATVRTTTSIYAVAPVPVPLRAAPTLTGATVIYVGDLNGTATLSLSMSGNVLQGSGSISWSVGTAGQCGALASGPTNSVTLSSEL